MQVATRRIDFNVLRRSAWSPVLMVLAYALIVFAFVVLISCDARIYVPAWRAFSMGTRGAGLALVLWAAWSPRPLLRYPAAAIAMFWIFGVWYLGEAWWTGRLRPGNPDWILTPLWMSWWSIVLLTLRWAARTRIVNVAEDAATQKPLQFGLRDMFGWTAVVGFTLMLAKLVFSPPGETWQDGLNGLLQNVIPNSYYHADPLFMCLGAMPLAIAIVFRWRWLPAAVVIMLITAFLGSAFHDWWTSKPLFTSFRRLTPIWFVQLLSAAGHAAVLLAVLRWQGYRLMGGRTASAAVD